MEKKVIGYTTGVFDLFHIGHLNILRRSKELCDYLIVGVSTDELVRSYKNKTPIVPFEDRIKIVEAIRYVDETIPQETMDKMEAWKKIKFDIMFHGDDWKGSDLYVKMEKEFEKVGAKIVYLPHTEGVSATMLSERVKNENS